MTWLTTQSNIPLASKNILRRGFKANAERLAKQYREELKLHPCGALCALKLAEHLRIPIYPATHFLKLEDETQWLSNNCEWSALTMPNSQGRIIILHNPFHSTARQQSDIMHELAHIICEHKHEQNAKELLLPFGMRNYNVEQEEEAKCLGSTLQLATPCLLWAVKKGLSITAIAEYFNASSDMVTYRLNMTGISKRFQYGFKTK